MPEITVFRGQKRWSRGMEITAPSLRHSLGDEDPIVHTASLLSQLDGMIRRAPMGIPEAVVQLEKQLFHSQLAAYANPFVSCTYEWGVANSFATKGNAPGYLLTVMGDDSAGLDFENLRLELNIKPDGLDYLREFGIRERLNPHFSIASVDMVAPYGQAVTRIYP
jgi:hypothetical protein